MKLRKWILVGLVFGIILGLGLFRHHRQVPDTTPEAPFDAPQQMNYPNVRSRHGRPHVIAQSPNGHAEAVTSRTFTNAYVRLMEEGLNITPEQLEPYVQKNNRSAESLLAAYRVSRERAFLREAMEKSPDDPRVCFDAYLLTAFFEREKSTPEQISARLEAFKMAAPDNALPHYLAAHEHFKSGHHELALQELEAASSKPQLNDYSVEYVYLAEEAYRAAGCSEAEAKVMANVQLLLPQLSHYKQLAEELYALARQYLAVGDTASAYAAVQMAFDLGRRLDSADSRYSIIQRVGTEIQRRALRILEPHTPWGTTGHTVAQQLELVEQRRQALGELGKIGMALETLPDRDLIIFFDRTKLFGEEAALRWLQTICPSAPAQPHQ
ncbi:MAG: hypothetical protein N2379_08635 [Verrucomicrobiae bacterium]|nr:hypothetical protein [Verrucomicrobiae bacterium]